MGAPEEIKAHGCAAAPDHGAGEMGEARGVRTASGSCEFKYRFDEA
jgi:hypothetical protein